jgi:tetratricopeptide (TPR) repeat protein
LYYYRGISRERSDQWDLAEADFKKALELNPDQPLVLNYLAYTWVTKKENLDQALEMLKKAVDQRPDDGYIIDSVGWAYYMIGDYMSAVDYLERAVEFEPTVRRSTNIWAMPIGRSAAMRRRNSMAPRAQFRPKEDGWRRCRPNSTAASATIRLSKLESAYTFIKLCDLCALWLDFFFSFFAGLPVEHQFPRHPLARAGEDQSVLASDRATPTDFICSTA